MVVMVLVIVVGGFSLNLRVLFSLVYPRLSTEKKSLLRIFYIFIDKFIDTIFDGKLLSRNKIAKIPRRSFVEWIANGQSFGQLNNSVISPTKCLSTSAAYEQVH